MRYEDETIDNLIEFCNEFIDVYEEFASDVVKLNLKNNLEITTSHFIVRNRINIEALSSLLLLFKHHPNHKMSVFLILRSIISDTLSFLSLLTFVDPSGSEHVSLNNEINVLDRDFIKAMLDLHNEHDKLKVIDGIAKLFTSDDDNRTAAVKEEIYTSFDYLFDEKKIKTIKDLRKTSNVVFFENYEKKLGENLSTEKSKYLRILNHPNYKMMAPLYSMFKYFSQFQHYSRGSMFFFKHKQIESDVFYIMMCFTMLLTITDKQYEIILGKNNKYSELLNKAEKQLEKILLKN